MEEKSRSCNLCATWCSSCVHFGRVAATVGAGTDDFADKTYEGKRTGWGSSDDGILFSPSLSAACNCRQHASSEANNVFSVSPSDDSFSENAETQATSRDSDSCKYIESLLNVRKAQPCRGFGDTPKGLINFDDQRFSNKLEKHEELDILDDNISCTSRSQSANLATGNQNGGPDWKNASCISASDDSFPVVEKDVNERLFYLFVAGTHFDKANDNHHDAQNFTKEPPQALVIPNRSDIASLKDFYDCAISAKEEPSECSSKQVESSLARAALSGLGNQIDGVYSCATPTFIGADLHMNCVETESHSPCKKHLQKSISVIKNTCMQESWQTQQADLRGVSDLMDVEVTFCDICRDAGREKLLFVTSVLTGQNTSSYCMRVKLNEVPKGDWMCEECMVRSECQKSGSPVNLESWSSSKLKLNLHMLGKDE